MPVQLWMKKEPSKRPEMQGERLRRGMRGFAALLAVSCLAPDDARPQAAPNIQRGKDAQPNKDWPCRQILVSQISPASVWSGPPIEGVDWRSDPKIADLAAKLAQRRVPIEAAEQEIADFAKSAGENKKAKLTALFAALFDKLNGERSQVIDGLIRFGKKQRDLADRIRTENAAIQEAQDQSQDATDAEKTNAATERLQWDLRVFDDRRQSLSYVCETPALIEQRLFALARAIQQNLD
jgi:hypothetical protein